MDLEMDDKVKEDILKSLQSICPEITSSDDSPKQTVVLVLGYGDTKTSNDVMRLTEALSNKGFVVNVLTSEEASKLATIRVTSLPDIKDIELILGHPEQLSPIKEYCRNGNHYRSKKGKGDKARNKRTKYLSSF